MHLNDTPRISVVIPLYNKGDYIEATLVSVLAQTVLPYEIIIVDDVSDDGGDRIAAAMLKKASCATQFIRHPRNSGVAATRNTGIKASRGEYIAGLDADDLWRPDHIEKALRLIQDFPEGTFYSFNHIVRTAEGQYYEHVHAMDRDFRGYVTDFCECTRKNSEPVQSSKVVIKKTALEHIGGFVGYSNVGEDINAWIMLGLQGRFVYENTVTAEIRIDRERRTRRGEVFLPIEYFARPENRKHLSSSARDYIFRKYVLHTINLRMSRNDRLFWQQFNKGLLLFPVRGFAGVLLYIVPPFMYGWCIRIKHRYRHWAQSSGR